MPIRVKPRSKKDRTKIVDFGPSSGFTFEEATVSANDYAISENGRRLEKLTNDWYEYALVEQGFDPAGGDQRFRVRVAKTEFNCCINVGLVPPAPKEEVHAPKLTTKVKQLAEKFLPLGQSKKAAQAAVVIDPNSVPARMSRSLEVRGWCIGSAFGSLYRQGVLLEQAEIAAEVGTVLAFKINPERRVLTFEIDGRPAGSPIAIALPAEQIATLRPAVQLKFKGDVVEIL